VSRDCVVCGCGTYPRAPRPDPEQLAVWKAEGRRGASGRGACVNCYQRYRMAGRLSELSMTRALAHGEHDPEANACPRCGISHRNPAGVCQDCELVLVDLGELERWAS